MSGKLPAVFGTTSEKSCKENNDVYSSIKYLNKGFDKINYKKLLNKMHTYLHYDTAFFCSINVDFKKYSFVTHFSECSRN